MIRYQIPIIFLLTILFSSLFFDYWNFIFKLTVNNLSELLIFVENKFLLSLMFFTILYLVSTALSLPIGTFLTFLGGYIVVVFIGFFLVVIGATLGAVILFLIIKIGFIKSVESIQRKPGLLNKIKLGIEKDIWSYLFFIRFFPVFPFGLLILLQQYLALDFFIFSNYFFWYNAWYIIHNNDWIWGGRYCKSKRRFQFGCF